MIWPMKVEREKYKNDIKEEDSENVPEIPRIWTEPTQAELSLVNFIFAGAWKNRRFFFGDILHLA